MIIAIASGKGGVGKTTVSVNAAVLLSFLGRTILVDGDVALPNVHVHLNFNPSVALPEVLKGEVSLEEAIYEMRFKVGKKRLLSTFFFLQDLSRKLSSTVFRRLLKSSKEITILL